MTDFLHILSRISSSNDELDFDSSLLSGAASVPGDSRAEMSPHQHRRQHRHVQVRQELHHALREAGPEPGDREEEAEQTDDTIREDSLLTS